GLTVGTRDSEQIALNTIGRELLYATSPEAERDALRTAFFNVPVFKTAYEYYKGGKLPELKYLQNTLESVFNVSINYHQDFVRVYTQNCVFLEKYGITPEEGIASLTEQAADSPRSIVVGEPKSKTS